MIRIEGLRFRYPAAEGDFTLRIPRFDLKTGERLAITGPSGTGKTTRFFTAPSATRTNLFTRGSS